MESKLDRLVADSQRHRLLREQGYREQALKMYPWICARCGREFHRETLHQLTVHHKDHNHDNNPADGSNWELLCLYCHDHEHARFIDQHGGGDPDSPSAASSGARHQPFADLARLLKDKP